MPKTFRTIGVSHGRYYRLKFLRILQNNLDINLLPDNSKWFGFYRHFVIGYLQIAWLSSRPGALGDLDAIFTVDSREFLGLVHVDITKILHALVKLLEPYEDFEFF